MGEVVISQVILNPSNYISNGEYQKIVWLGVNGYIIINEREKEILVIDPWPSYSKRTLKKSRVINQLSNWLYNAYNNNDYKLIGIIATHEHYDHIADIPAIMYKLYKRGIKDNDLPPIYSDQGTFNEIKRRFEKKFKDYNSRVILYHKQFALDEKPLYYDDKTQKNKEKDKIKNYPLIAGTKLNKVEIGNFEITPYIWDHATSLDFDTILGVASGNYQRCTAIFLKHKNDEEKTLFLVGSAGEMSNDGTSDLVVDVNIETDILIQAVPHKVISKGSYEKNLRELVEYQKNNIKVKRTIIACHFENFVKTRGINNQPGELLSGKNNLKRIEKYMQSINKSVYFTNRFLIEFGSKMIVECEDGYFYEDLILLESIDQGWNDPRFADFKKLRLLNANFLLFKDEYIINPNTKEVHRIGDIFRIENGTKIYYARPGCNMHLMNFLNKRHYNKLDDALNAGYDYCAYCFGFSASKR